jgi:putative endonuclease
MARKTGNRQEARQRAEQQGRTAELDALVYLMLTCHRILARRWRGSVGEIDLVARRGRRIIFVEVKFRHRSDAGSDAGSGAGSDAGGIPTAQQRQRIARAAQQFCRQRRISPAFELRFDLIQISPSFGGILFSIRHIRDAWWAMI